MALPSSTNSIPPPTNSEITPPQVTDPPPQIKIKQEEETEAIAVSESKPDLLNIQDFDYTNQVEKYRKYESDYTSRLKAKYFSKMTSTGGNIYEKEMVIDGEVIKASRFPCTKSFTDPVQYMEDQSKT